MYLYGPTSTTPLGNHPSQDDLRTTVEQRSPYSTSGARSGHKSVILASPCLTSLETRHEPDPLYSVSNDHTSNSSETAVGQSQPFFLAAHVPVFARVSVSHATVPARISTMPPSQQRQTAEKLVASFNAMDLPAIFSIRSPECMRQILPQSLEIASQDNDTFTRSLEYLIPAFRNFSLTQHDLIEDLEARKIVLWLTARADTAAGEYRNEYIWILKFDESGTKLVDIKEYVDAIVNKEFFPKLSQSVRDLKST